MTEISAEKGEDRVLREYFNMLFPETLTKREFINVVCIGKEHTIEKFIKDFNEFKDVVLKYRHHYDVFVRLSTIREISRKRKGIKSHLYKRHVLFLDFDLKDFPDSNGKAGFFSDLIREKTDTFHHMIVNSGHGYHYYICTECTTDINTITDLNMQLINLTGADANAGLCTQIARVPCTYNHKETNNGGEKQYVKVVSSAMNNINFYRYNIQSLISKIGLETRTAQKNEQMLKTYPEVLECSKAECSFFCNQVIFENGAPEGQRNFWLGRLTAMYKLQGVAYDMALARVLDWNKRCYPPQDESKLNNDFNGYWLGNYKLLGCPESLVNKGQKQMVEAVCDKARCRSYGNIVLRQQHGVKFAKDLLTKKKMQKLSGYHYFLLSIIYLHGGMQVQKLIDRLTVRLAKGKFIHQCMSERQAYKLLDELTAEKIITVTPPRNNPKAQKRFHRIQIVKRFREFEQGYILFYYSAAMALRMDVISYSDYKVYLCLVNCLQGGLSCTYESLGEILNMSKSQISEHIKNLEMNDLLIIKKKPIDYGLMDYNFYTLFDPSEISGINIYDADENGYVVEEIRLVS